MSNRLCARFAIRFTWPICLLLMPATVLAQQFAPPLGEKEAAIETVLAQQTNLDFSDNQLSEVAEFLKQQHQIQIQIDHKALADAGVGSDTTITRKVHDLKLSSALDLLLSELDLTYVIRDEVLMITTKTEAENLLSTRVYPVDDLVTSDDDDLTVSFGSNFSEIVDLITSTLKPESWDETGGPGTIKQHHKSMSLVVSQTDAVHREISTLLESLRVVDQRHSERRRAPRAPVADDSGLQLKIYKLPPRWLLAGVQGIGGSPAVPTTQPPATQPPAAPTDSKPPVGVQPQLGGMAGGPSPSLAASPRQHDSKVRELAQVIQKVIEPDSWEDAGGQGVIHGIQDTLVVRQTAAVHRQIRRMVEAMCSGDGMRPGIGGGMGGGRGMF